MAGILFPETPRVGAAPAAPGTDPASLAAQDAAAEAARIRAATGGSASTILTSPLGDSSSSSVAKILLGS